MWSKRAASWILLLSLLLSLPGLAASEPEDETVSPPLTLRTGGEEHIAYLHGYEDGTFRPGGFITRAEEAQMLYALLKKDTGERVSIPDVSPHDWFYDAVSLFAARGILDREPDGTVHPNEQLTRAQFVMILTRLFPDLPEGECDYSDISKYAPWYRAVARATTAGWVNGYGDGTFRPYDRITRAEAVTAVNRALGRSADKERIDDEVVLPLYRDLKDTHWAYYQIVEASIGHTQTQGPDGEHWKELEDSLLCYEPGPLLLEGELYYAGSDGRLLRNTQLGSLSFGEDGRYSSGDGEIDEYVKTALASVVTEEMTREERLLAAYRYARDSFTYLRRNYYDMGDTSWTLEEARTMFETSRGNCYCYASVFLYMARQLGYDAVPVSGVVGWSRRPHAWVDIVFDGTEYIFDPELEMSYRVKGNYSYDFYHMAYADVPWPYEK